MSDEIKDLYPELEGDLIIGLWKRTQAFFTELAHKKQAQPYWITLKENYAHDYCWVAEAEMMTGSMENPNIIQYKGWGLEAHEAMLNLFHKVKNDLPEKEEPKDSGGEDPNFPLDEERSDMGAI